jgi:uncharacterized glyoxalase superfamily protein PhnB
MATKKTSKPAARKPASKTVARKKRPAPARARSQASGALKLRSASPGFTVNDIQQSLAWYRDVMGFAVKRRWEHEGQLMGAELAAGNVVFMIGQDDWKKGRNRVKGEGFRIYCETTQDVDRLAAGIRARGGVLLQAPRDEPWGTRDFAVADPDGFKITIASEP